MTTAATQPPPRLPTPRPKPSSRTSALQSESTAPSKPQPNQFPASTESFAQSHQPGGARRGGRTASADPLSDKATAFLIRRILCPQQADKGKGSPDSIEGLLPPLTSRNDVDLQLYALIAIILREFVQNWYAKITPDEDFVAEIVQIIAHITRALEQRLRKVDLESLLFDELPDLLDKHLASDALTPQNAPAYRVAHDPIAQPPVRTDPREIYHSLCPLPALSPVPRPEDPESVAVQAENEAAYRQLLVHAFLAILLPTEDLENDCLTALVGQIFSELIIGNTVANRLSEPWLIWELLIIASRTAGRPKTAEDQDRPGQSSNGSSAPKRRFSAHALFWAVLQWCFLGVSFIRTVIAILMTSGSLPPRASHGASPKSATQHETGQGRTHLTSPFDADLHAPRMPLLAFRTWSAVSNLAEMDIRMPWLRGVLAMLQWIAIMGPGRIAGVDGVLDR
ncbi:PXA domain-containing protein [Chaetomium sp. MPI-CAGE-AT-0009]|nr:PXA domain-containing protein [Chaetomium sp. MPI-CAGE-AT-0009]